MTLEQRQTKVADSSANITFIQTSTVKDCPSLSHSSLIFVRVLILVQNWLISYGSVINNNSSVYILYLKGVLLWVYILPICFPFITLPFCLYLLQGLVTADWEQHVLPQSVLAYRVTCSLSLFQLTALLLEPRSISISNSWLRNADALF